MPTTPLISPLGNGNGSYFVRCHCCHATSPGCPQSDDLRILASAKAAGWVAVMVEASGQFRLYCSKPQCQRQSHTI